MFVYFIAFVEKSQDVGVASHEKNLKPNSY